MIDSNAAKKSAESSPEAVAEAKAPHTSASEPMNQLSDSAVRTGDSAAIANSSDPPSSDSIDQLTVQVARGSSWVLVGSLFGRIIQFALHVVLSRGLGASSYGLYAMGRSVMHVMQQIGGLGLPAGVVRFGAPQHSQKEDSALKGTLIASFLISGIASAVLGALLFFGAGWISVHVFHEPSFKVVLQVFSVSLPFYMLNFLASRAARAFQRMKHDVVIGTILQPFLNIIMVGVAFALGFGLGGAVYAFLFAMVISAGAGVYFVYRLFPLLVSSLRPVFSVGKLMRYSVLVLGAGISTLLLGETDRLMLGMLATATDVGVYNVAVLVSTQMVFFLTAVNSSFMPMIADLYHRNCHSQLQELFRSTTRWVFTLSLPLLLVLLLFPGPVLTIFGPEFSVAAPALIILALAYFIDAGVGSVGFLLQMSDYHHVLAINNVIMAIVNVALNFWLIPEHGIVGAAVATGLAISIINLVKLIEVRILLRMHPYDRRYWKPIAAGIAAAITGLGIHATIDVAWNWLIGLLLSLIVYAALLYLFGPEPQDRLAFRTILRRKAAGLLSNDGSVSENGRTDPR